MNVTTAFTIATELLHVKILMDRTFVHVTLVGKVMELNALTSMNVLLATTTAR